MARKHRTPLDLTGQRFGRLVALRIAFKHPVSKRLYWLCRCDCGIEKAIDRLLLRSGKTQSCGCLQKELVAHRLRTHAMTDTPEYHTWAGIKRRCNNPKDKDYGGRGITVCQYWQSFEHFFADMGTKPAPEHEIDRIDNDAGYWCGHCEECTKNKQPPNCRWVTHLENSNNTRHCRYVTYEGKTQTISAWAREYGLTASALGSRLLKGWPMNEALSTPQKVPRVITFQGKTQTLGAWAKELNTCRPMIFNRLKLGWSIEDALMLPAGARRLS